ncbi:MAG: F0F1 ATP synthase subunit delta [Bacteroidaceae bacterium]|nr:F0F1 ATP synthase subunit delta [Bacteroidaceae bacterium]
MNAGIVSSRYAKALLEYATELHIEEDIYRSMFTLIASISEVKDFLVALQNPMLSSVDKVNLVCEAAQDNTVHFTHFIRLVIKQGREEFLLFMAQSYIMLYRRHKNIASVKLTSAVALPHNIEQRIINLIKECGYSEVELENIVDDSIIGGFILETDSRRLDASLSGALRKIEKQIVDNNRRLV